MGGALLGPPPQFDKSFIYEEYLHRPCPMKMRNEHIYCSIYALFIAELRNEQRQSGAYASWQPELAQSPSRLPPASSINARRLSIYSNQTASVLTMSTNSQNVPAPNTPRPRPVQGVAGLVAKSLTGLVNLPGLRDSAKAVHDMAVALKVSSL